MPSMDIVNKLEMTEVVNALEQARKELIQRYDFKGTNTAIDLIEKDKTLTIKSNSEDRINAAFEVLLGRMMKRNVSPKCLDRQVFEQAPGGVVKQLIKLKDGIDDVSAKKIVKIVKESFPKVQGSIQGNVVRASSKNRDDLQAVIAHLRAQEFDVPLQFTNFRD